MKSRQETTMHLIIFLLRTHFNALYDMQTPQMTLLNYQGYFQHYWYIDHAWSATQESGLNFKPYNETHVV
jgi:hypothetical protein